MANQRLFHSALVCATIHGLGIFVYVPHPLYAAFLLCCVGASLANHGLTSSVAKWVDRSCMYVGVPITLWLAPQHVVRIFTLGAGGVYMLGKYSNSSILHSISHGMITSVNILILNAWNINN